MEVEPRRLGDRLATEDEKEGGFKEVLSVSGGEWMEVAPTELENTGKQPGFRGKDEVS